MMSNRNFNGVQINQTATLVENAGAAIADCRNKAMIYDNDGNVILAADGTKPFVGIALIEAGFNDISGLESGKVSVGDEIEIQIKDIGYLLAGEEIVKGTEVTADKDGCAKTAVAGDYILGIALSTVSKEEYCRLQITKYQKN